MKNFEEAKDSTMQSGSLKFDLDYVSTKQVYEAAQKWAESDSNLLLVSVRGGGSNQAAVDFRYLAPELAEGLSGGTLLHSKFKPFFEKVLGGDYIKGWDYANPTYIIK